MKERILICYLTNCQYWGTEACRVYNLGVKGIQECVKYKPEKKDSK